MMGRTVSASQITDNKKIPQPVFDNSHDLDPAIITNKNQLRNNKKQGVEGLALEPDDESAPIPIKNNMKRKTAVQTKPQYLTMQYVMGVVWLFVLLNFMLGCMPILGGRGLLRSPTELI